MGVNRIVMHNGVVWWLPPLRAKNEGERPRSPRRRGTRRFIRWGGAGLL